MKKYFQNSFPLWVVLLLLQVLCAEQIVAQSDTALKVSQPFTDDPAAVKEEVTYDPETKRYKKVRKIGDLVVGTETMTFDQYWAERYKQSEKKYFQEKAKAENFDKEKSLLPQLKLPQGGLVDGLFGSNKVEIKPTGSAELIFGLNSSTTKNPAIPVRNQTNTNFQFNQKIQLNIIGTIGDKLKLTTSYNTESTFDFENQMKLEYNGSEDEIVKKIEVGNVSLPLQTQLIQGSQSLFGVKAEMQFGKLNVTSIVTQQKGDSKSIETSGGVQIRDFKIQADQYEANRHFFLSQYFAESYDSALSALPFVNSAVQLTRVEVWITNVGNNNNEEARKIVGFIDLGEHLPFDANLFVNAGLYPYNNLNNLYGNVTANGNVRGFTNASGALSAMGYVEGANFNKIENARKLKSDEFTFHPQLGYISLNRQLNADEILAVAFQYTVTGKTEVFQVGEFSNDITNSAQALFLKLLKTNTVNNTHLPTWELMMKNVYSLGESGIKGETFQMQILYTDPSSNQDINFVDLGGNKAKRWVELMGADQMNIQQDTISDGFYDFIEGLTIKANNGRIYFPVRKPFGEYLRKKLGNAALANKFCFDSLYTVTPIAAQTKYPAKDRFKFWVKYESSQSSVINLNSMNIPQGSVVVTAGGKRLVENQDYTVNYSGGQVTIINEGILNSSTPIKVSLETNALFSIQTKNLLGSHLEYKFSDNYNLGGTIMNLTERPLTSKVDIGEEPMSNTIWGLNTKYRTDLPFVTKVLDKLPLLSTKEMSTIDVTGEFAQLLPGTSSAIQNVNSGRGESFIDNFEGAESNTTLTVRTSWFPASTPHGLEESGMFPEGRLLNDLANGFNRAKMSWYNIDPLFSDNSGLTPDYLKNDAAQQNNNFVRPINQTEVFPQKSGQNGIVPNLITLDLAYFPQERGQYNFDTVGGIYSSGVNANGTLKDPNSRWGGIMRKIETPDFEFSNIEFLEFWMLDPFFDDEGAQKDYEIFNGSQEGGDMIIHIGNLSEDVLRDSRKSFENGLPTNNTDLSAVDTTAWGLVPTSLNLVNAFNNDPATRPFQDVGYDGLTDDREKVFFNKYLNYYNAAFGAIPQSIADDPSADNFKHYRDESFNSAQSKVIERYKDFSGVHGNSPASTNSAYLASATTIPDIEDLNRDNTLNEGESYYQYHISLRPNDLQLDQEAGRNYINNIVSPTVGAINGYVKNNVKSRWIHFRIPIRKPERAIGSIQDFRSMRYIRILLKGWSKPVILRFGKIDLVRETWRKYENQMKGECEFVAADNNTHFIVTSINVEEDSQKEPIPYVPPVQRVYNVQTQSNMNEQALYLNINGLDGCDSRAAFKNTLIDMRSYNCLKMFVHAEKIGNASEDYNNKMTVFLRMGSDFDDNYYEYEIPLKFTVSPIDVNNKEAAIAAIWPSENSFDFDLSLLTEAKLERNEALAADPANFFKSQRYRVVDGKNNVYVKGSPTMSSIKVIMIGVRNNGDPGVKRSLGVWANELRLSCFNDQSGWAATATASMKLADFANLSVTGKMYTPGWGNITDKVAARKKEYYQMYDALASLELGKLIPAKYNVSIPVYLGYSETFQNQQFSPLDQDVLMTSLSPDVRRKVQDSTQTYQRRKSLNLSNVRKNRSSTSTAKPMPYDIENFDATYAFNETFKSDVNMRYNVLQTYKGALNYNYTIQPKNFQPFIQSPIVGFFKKVREESYEEKVSRMQEEIDRLRKQKTATAELSKLEKEMKKVQDKKAAFTKAAKGLMQSPYNKIGREFNFYLMPSRIAVRSDWNRLYNESIVRNNSDAVLLIAPVFNKNFYWDRNYDVSWDLSKAIKFKYAAVNRARIDEPQGRIDSKVKQDTLVTNLKNFGRNTNFSQTMDFGYELPLKKIPFTDWITANAKYTAKVDWQAAPLSAESIDNTISNSNTKQLTANFNLVSFYNKIPYLKKINNEAGNKPKPAATDSTKKKVVFEPLNLVNSALRLVMLLRNASFTYSENNGTFLPGYVPNTRLVGMDFDRNSPGADFLFGGQGDILSKAAQEGWLTTNSQQLNTRYSRSHSENLSVRATMEPIPKMRIELTGTRAFSKDSSFIYRVDAQHNVSNFSSTATYTFSITTITLGSAFEFGNTDNASVVYTAFLNSRAGIASRLAADQHNADPNYNPSTTGGFPTGYGRTQTDVLVQSFITTYTGGNAVSSPMVTMPKIPLPNWKLNYDGMMKIPFVAKYFQSFTMSHSYTSTLNQGFSKNLSFEDDGFGYTTKADTVGQSGNFVSKYNYASIVMSESLSPLVKVDATLKNSWIAKFELKKTRTVQLNLTGLSVSEVSNFGITAGTGYKIKDVRFPILVMGKKIKSNLDLRVDLTVTQSKTILRTIDGASIVQNGTNIVSVKSVADYVLSDKLNLRVFYDVVFNTPANSLSFPSSTSNGGISLRYTL